MAELEKKELTEKNLTSGDKKPRRIRSNDHVVRKRLPPRLPKKPNDVYVTNKSSFKCELAKCEKLLESGESEIFVHGLGSAVNRAINLALQLQTKFAGTVQVSVNTSTVTLVDDLEPAADHASYETQTRQNSSVHIRIYQTVILGTNN